MACEAVDAAARRIIDAEGYGEAFFHRTGHGIGLEEHEDPYIVSGNTTPLEPGHAFSVEPGIYIPGRWGARLEDIVGCHIFMITVRPAVFEPTRRARRGEEPSQAFHDVPGEASVLEIVRVNPEA